MRLCKSRPYDLVFTCFIHFATSATGSGKQDGSLSMATSEEISQRYPKEIELDSGVIPPTSTVPARQTCWPTRSTLASSHALD